MNGRELHALYEQVNAELNCVVDDYDNSCDADAFDLLAEKLTHELGDNADVRAFQEKFDIPMSQIPAFLDGKAERFRTKFLQEELDEFKEACQHQDLAKAFDALLDLAYVVHGTALMMGLPWDKGWAEVQRANMQKVRATDPTASKRGSPLDVVKPVGWQPPNHHQHLENAALTGSYFDTATRAIK